MVDESKENQAESGSSSEPDELAMETVRELSPEIADRAAKILDGLLTEAQQEKEMEKLLEEFQVRVNEEYQRKLKEKNNS